MTCLSLCRSGFRCLPRLAREAATGNEPSSSSSSSSVMLVLKHHHLAVYPWSVVTRTLHYTVTLPTRLWVINFLFDYRQYHIKTHSSCDPFQLRPIPLSALSSLAYDPFWYSPRFVIVASSFYYFIVITDDSTNNLGWFLNTFYNTDYLLQYWLYWYTANMRCAIVIAIIKDVHHETVTNIIMMTPHRNPNPNYPNYSYRNPNLMVAPSRCWG